MPCKPGPRIPFEQFGVNFADRILTAGTINHSVAALLRKVDAAELHGTREIEQKQVRFMAVLEPSRTERSVTAAGLHFKVTLPMAVSIEVLDLPDKPNYTLRVEAVLHLLGYPASPLFVVLEPQPFTTAAVRVVTEDKEEGLLTKFLSLFESIEDKVLEGVRSTVVEIVNKTLRGAGDALCIDVESKVQAALGQ
jgi:hypothetical protein